MRHLALNRTHSPVAGAFQSNVALRPETVRATGRPVSKQVNRVLYDHRDRTDYGETSK